MEKSMRGKSAEEIKEYLEKISRNIIILEKFNTILNNGKGMNTAKANENQLVMVDTVNSFKSVMTLINSFDGENANSYRRKMANMKERFQTIMNEIKNNEERGLVEARKSMKRLSEHDGTEKELEEGKFRFE